VIDPGVVQIRVVPVLDQEAMRVVVDQICEQVADAVRAGFAQALGEHELKADEAFAKASRDTRRRPLDHDPAAVRRRRLALGMTQAKVAEAAGIATSTMSELESGTRNVSPVALAGLAEALNCAPADLMPPVSNAAVAEPAEQLVDLAR
jgi:DNA-binding XRE family transcriptional regulator